MIPSANGLIGMKYLQVVCKQPLITCYHPFPGGHIAPPWVMYIRRDVWSLSLEERANALPNDIFYGGHSPMASSTARCTVFAPNFNSSCTPLPLLSAILGLARNDNLEWGKFVVPMRMYMSQEVYQWCKILTCTLDEFLVGEFVYL